IETIDCTMVQIALPRDFRGSVYSVTHKNALITRVRTRDGAVGEAVNGEGQAPILLAAKKVLVEQIVPLLIGKDASQIERCWKLYFPSPIVLGSTAARRYARWPASTARCGTLRPRRPT